MMSNPLTPGELAIVDQVFAELGSQLDRIVAAHRREVANIAVPVPEAAFIAAAASLLQQMLGPDSLSTLLAIAVARLAADDE